MKEVEKIMEKWASKNARLTLYVEREKALGMDLGLEDYWVFLAKFEKNEERNAQEVIANLLHHGYVFRSVDADGLVGTVAAFFS